MQKINGKFWQIPVLSSSVFRKVAKCQTSEAYRAVTLINLRDKVNFSGMFLNLFRLLQLNFYPPSQKTTGMNA